MITSESEHYFLSAYLSFLPREDLAVCLDICIYTGQYYLAFARISALQNDRIFSFVKSHHCGPCHVSICCSLFLWIIFYSL